MKTRKISLHCLLLLSLLFQPALAFAATGFAGIFGYTAEPQQNLDYLPQWLAALERHLLQDVPEGDCSETSFNRCHLQNWLAYLDTIKSRPALEQIDAVNLYANKKDYILDMTNYGTQDYWAIAREFLYNGGDCEDYAITKFFSLRWLGFEMDTLRIVILQDTNLRIAHAVLAVSHDNDILILDNQTQQVVSHQAIAHYLPLYSVNENKWWLHLPKM